MEHFYNTIDGWFDFESIYSEMVRNFPDGSHFVELGSWMGRSTSYMAVEIKNSGKKIRFDAIDTWEGSKGSWDENVHDEKVNSLTGSLYQTFLNNISPLKDYVNPIQGYTYDIVNIYDDNTLDFVFIDAAHDYDSIKKDIMDWYPKVKNGGVIGGHDYNNNDWPGVVKAVTEFFSGKENVRVVNNLTGSWVVIKEQTELVYNGYVYIKDDKIYFTSYTDIKNANINIKNLIGDVIFTTNLKDYEKLSNYWVQPDNKSYLKGFVLEVTQNNKIIMNLEYDSNKSTDNEMRICLYTMVLDEEVILPFTLDYYINYVGVNKFVIYDGGSKDRSKEIASQYPQVEIVHQKDDVTDSFRDLKIWNHEWKRDRQDFDWMIVCTPDEFLYHPDLRNKLLQYKREGITIPLIEGFNMISIKQPEFKKGDYLPYQIKKGVKDPVFYNKNIIFNPRTIDINYRVGCHACNPSGNVLFSKKEELKLLHFQKLSYENFTSESARKDARRSQKMIETGAGEHYTTNKNLSFEEYQKIYDSADYVLSSFVADDNIDFEGNLEKLKIERLKILETFLEKEMNLTIHGSKRSVKIFNIKDIDDRCKLLKNILDIKGYKKILDVNQIIYEKEIEKEIHTFSHNYLINDWYRILSNQLQKIKSSGLYHVAKKMHFCAYGDDENWSKFESFLKAFDKDKKFIIVRHTDNFFEYKTLQYLWDFINKYDKECQILYFHLKGVWSRYNLQVDKNGLRDLSIPTINPDAVKQWKNILEYFTIERWYNCVDILNNEYDTVGPLYNYNPDCPIYTGNFWWANSNHIKNLKRLDFIKDEEPHIETLWVRIKCEKWVNSIPNKFNNLYTPRDLNLYVTIINPSEYRDDINPLVSIITSSYKKHDELKSCVNSVLNQTYTNWEHLICSDGYDEITENIVKEYNDERIKYFFTEQTNDWGSTQKNILTNKANGKYLVYLDDDNIIYPEHLSTVTIGFYGGNIGMVISKIDYDGLEYKLPIENKILLGKIDTLNLTVDKYYTKYAVWKNYAGQDYEFAKICEFNITNHSKKIEYITDVVGRHVDNKYKSIKYSFITPTYNRHKSLKLAIESVLSQKHQNWEMLICCDGEDKIVENMIKSFNDVRIIYYFTKPTNFFGTHQRNFLLDKTSGDYVIFLDDDNIIYPNYLEVINQKIDDSDMLVYRIDYEDYEFNVLPIENKIEHRRIDTLNFVVKKIFTNKYKWRRLYEHDYLYFKNIEADIIEGNGSIKYIPDIIAKHKKKEFLGDQNLSIEKEAGNKNIVYVITSHPNYKMASDITKKTLTKIKSFGENVILSSHHPVDIDLQKLSDYFIYDKNNPLIKHDFYTNSWFTTDEFFAHLNITKLDNNINHALGVYLNYYNSLIYAKSLGFNIAVCTNFDMVFSDHDKTIIDNKISQMTNKGKKAFYMNTPETEGIHYKTIFFITEIDFFLNTFKYLTDEKMYMEEMKKVGSNTNCLENFFYHSLKNKTSELLLEQINEDVLFPTSEINLFSLIEYNTILPVENEPNKFVYWFSSANTIDSRKIKVFIKKNGMIIYHFKSIIDREFVFYKKIKFTDGDYFEINTVINDETEILKNKTIIVNNDIFFDIKSYGNFIDKIDSEVI